MLVNEGLLRDLLRLIVWYPVRWISECVPVRTSFSLYRFFGTLHFLLSRHRRQLLAANIKQARTLSRNPEMRNTVRRYLQNHYIDRLHIFTYPRLKDATCFDSIAVLKGMDILDETLKAGKGAVVVLGHYGVIQLPLFRLGQLGYRMIQIGLPVADQVSWIGRFVAFRLRLRYEAMIPAAIIPADRFLRPVFKHLQSNGVLMTNIDPAGGGRWIGRMMPCRFLGHRIPIPLGPAELSIRTGAPILPLSVKTASDQRYIYTIHPPIHDGSDADPETVTGKLAEWYQAAINENPALWHFWDEFEKGKLILPEDDQILMESNRSSLSASSG